MNLYDNDDGKRRFTLDEANRVLPDLISATEKIVTGLEILRKKHDIDVDMRLENANQEFQKEASQLLASWSKQVADLGAYPKGYFVVDFMSKVPGTLLCWTFGEYKIMHTHKIFEKFKHRRPIRDEINIGFEYSLN